MQHKNTFKYDIKRTFMFYTIIPIVILAFSSYMISVYIFMHNTSSYNQNQNRHLQDSLNEYFKNYETILNDLSKNSSIISTIKSKQTDVETCQLLYNYINSTGVKTYFYVFDKDKNIIISNTNKTPLYAEKNKYNLGILSRLETSKEDHLVECNLDSTNLENTITYGAKIKENNTVIGYLTFDIYADSLIKHYLSDYSLITVLTDRYENVLFTTSTLPITRQGKLENFIKDNAGFIKYFKCYYFITKSNSYNGIFNIYTINSLGNMITIFKIIGILLITFIIILIAFLMYSSSKVSKNKTRDLDKILKALENVQNGDLNTRLNIKTNIEFKIISDAYNKMLDDIKNLIELNKEEAKHSIISEIKQLESQFNPHFLFNTLEVIKYMIKINPQDATKMIINLSKLLRYSIDNNYSEVSIEDELNYTKSYLEIIKTRFKEKFEYDIKVDNHLINCLVPKLIFQPIIENCVEHGYKGDNKLNIDICIENKNNNLNISIKDNGIGINQSKLEEINEILKNNQNKSNHLGIYNVHRRIQLLYGDEYGIKIKSKENVGTEVFIKLPLNFKKEC
ncbi:sensor histidine kinase [Thermobrachium celere]|uniref:Two-component sensor kinase, associated with ferric iron transporter, SPy1061 homolog n=1 Tax=Thermobrachium celere DSM 8682 TaxID=941824 RepID=R7RQQ1_9CLOT|nr:histidine kinase [Thermobrachium celere]CDF57681.1 Two-component sensor kinase, associated with ferric iron transporter, SPy1061 homolog [Thermobrachium celere DSM 8682]